MNRFDPLKIEQTALERFGHTPRYFVRTYGCQQNVNDSERIKGMLEQCGFAETDAVEAADLVVFNTCAVREHAEDRVYGNLGRLKNIKEDINPRLIIALGGCMVQQSGVAENIKKRYPYASILFDTNDLGAFPGLLYNYMTEQRRVFAECSAPIMDETLPIKRDSSFKAWLPIMYGCNNFCSYCIVPYVRGRERSRAKSDIISEFRSLVGAGYREITLLGQNVNSYEDGEGGGFADLLDTLADTEGEYIIRFMTSHPKDASERLFDVIAAHPNISRHFHLPVQSGSDRILKLMNRRYTAQHYLSLIEYAKSKIPGISFTSDIIVGFPGETDEDFEATMELVRRVDYRDLFTFIYSKRTGTPAAEMPDSTLHAEKVKRLDRLTELQNAATVRHESALVGKTLRGLPEQRDGCVCVRLDTNSVVYTKTPYDSEMCNFVSVKITAYENRRLEGELV